MVHLKMGTWKFGDEPNLGFPSSGEPFVKPWESIRNVKISGLLVLCLSKDGCLVYTLEDVDYGTYKSPIFGQEHDLPSTSMFIVPAVNLQGCK